MVHSTIRQVSRNALERVDRLAAHVTEQVIRSESELADSTVVPVSDVSETVLGLMRNFYLHLAEGVPPDAAAVRAVGRRRAQQGVPLPAVLHGFRIGFRLAWKHLVDQSPADDVDAMRALVEQADHVWVLLDDFCGELRDAYQERAAELLRLTELEQRQHLDVLLAPAPIETGRRLLSAHALGLPHEGRFLVIAAQDGTPGDQSSWDVALTTHGARVLWRDSHEATIGLVSAGPPPLEWEALPGRLRVHGYVRLGVGGAFTSVEDAPRALHQARFALGGVPRSTGGIRHYGQDPVGCLAAANPDEAVDLARIVLRHLAGLPVRQRDTLLDTLSAWLAAGGSTDEAAQALYCHRNTVRYRLRHVEEITGLDLKDPRDTAQLCLALTTVEQRGRTFLDRTS